MSGDANCRDCRDSYVGICMFHAEQEQALAATQGIPQEIPGNPEAEALRYLLRLVASLESVRGYARWDQWLRHQFGDERAGPMIERLLQLAQMDEP